MELPVLAEIIPFQIDYQIESVCFFFFFFFFNVHFKVAYELLDVCLVVGLDLKYVSIFF